MNQVSWRRILQRAGHEYPGDGGAAARHMRDGAGGPRGNSKPSAAGREGGSGLLENELKRALDRAARREHEAKAMSTPPGWEPIFVAQELAAKPSSAPTAKRSKPAPPPAKKRTGSGTRNILAISLSAAVVGLAFQQIGTQWNESRGGGSAASTSGPEASAASLLYAGVRPSHSQQTAADDPQSLDLRPSLTQDTPSLDPVNSKEREDFLKEIEQAASILSAKQAEQAAKRGAPVTQLSAPLTKVSATSDLEPGAISQLEEQSMLRRARELMERGHITGARLLFEHLALQQSALGAFALAQTYDEKFLKSFFVKGLQPDQKLAAKWYRRAAELGSEAVDRR